VNGLQDQKQIEIIFGGTGRSLRTRPRAPERQLPEQDQGLHERLLAQNKIKKTIKIGQRLDHAQLRS
jgi:hypothetical protein